MMAKRSIRNALYATDAIKAWLGRSFTQKAVKRSAELAIRRNRQCFAIQLIVYKMDVKLV